MHLFTNWLLLAFSLPYPPNFAAAYCTQSSHIGSSFSSQTTLSHYPLSRSFFSRLRDGIIRTIWSVPQKERPHSGGLVSTVPTSNTPPSLLARYGGDLVLRFTLNSAEEAEALIHAVEVLFLDVWESNSEWVDVRLSEAVVMTAFHLH